MFHCYSLSRVLLNLALFIFICTTAFAEDTLVTINKIEEKLSLIKSISACLEIDYGILTSIIYIERTLNYDWEDVALDNIVAKAGYNSSIGFCQVKLKTAYWIEQQLLDTTSLYFPGNKYYHILSHSNRAEEIIENLNNDSLNILYAASYVKLISVRWRSTYDISSKPEILGALYSTGCFYKDGSERKPHRKPLPNKFGLLVKEAYEKIFKYY